MKCFSLSSSFTTSFIFLFSIVLLAASAYDTDHEDFRHCMASLTSNCISTLNSIVFTPATLTSSNSISTPNSIVFTPNDPSYSTLLNASILNPRYSSSANPSAIITPLHASHVQAIVHCSKRHGLQIRVKSGGHDYEGFSYASHVPFVVIDLVNLNSVSVDVESKSAWVQAGATLGELYYRIAEISGNLGFPAGACHTVGVGGHFTGGGYGFLARKHGLAADNIIDAEFVDAQGRILDRKSMGEDLFWAIRGGGAGSYGVVTAWKLQLIDVPSTVTVFDVWRNFEDDATKKLVYQWQSKATEVDEDLSIFLSFRTKTSVDKEGNKKIVIGASFQATFHGGVDILLELMGKEFPELGLQRQECAEMSWIESFVYHNDFRNGEPLEILLTKKSNFFMGPFKAKSDHVEEPVPEDALEGMLRMLYELEEGRGWIALYPYGGKMNEISESSIPFPHRAGNLYCVRYFVNWIDEKDMSEEIKHVSWVRRLYDYMTPHVAKNPRTTYFNFRDLDIGVDNNINEGETASIYSSVAQASTWGTKYFKNNFNRLVRVKAEIDPTNFFASEQNIPHLLSQ